jgi:hypothetical protein
MQSLKLYLYDHIIEIQIMDLSIFTVRNRQVYSRNIKIYQGIDNPVQVLIKNQDQKSVDLTGYTVEAQVQDPVEKITVYTFPCIWVDITKGVGTVTFEKTVIDTLEQRVYQVTFSVIKDSDNTERAMYADDNYQLPIGLEILPGFYSNQSPPLEVEESVIDGGTI